VERGSFFNFKRSLFFPHDFIHTTVQRDLSGWNQNPLPGGRLPPGVMQQGTAESQELKTKERSAIILASRSQDPVFFQLVLIQFFFDAEL
jgi:hypothetical protein